MTTQAQIDYCEQLYRRTRKGKLSDRQVAEGIKRLGFDLRNLSPRDAHVLITTLNRKLNKRHGHAWRGKLNLVF